ncbi:MAG: hypothetical protein V7724_03555 [Sediminicola sp.]
MKEEMKMKKMKMKNIYCLFEKKPGTNSAKTNNINEPTNNGKS